MAVYPISRDLQCNHLPSWTLQKDGGGGCSTAAPQLDWSAERDFNACVLLVQKSFEVDVFPIDSDGEGCSMLAVCGTTEQKKPLVFRAVDNMKRDGLDFVVRILDGKKTSEIHVKPIAVPSGRLLQSSASNASDSFAFMYEFTVEGDTVGILVLEILVDGEHIPESPLRVEIQERDCAADFNDKQRVADCDGNCGCDTNSVEVGGKCVAYHIFLPSIILPLVALLATGIWLYIEHKNKQADSVWSVQRSELFFGDPPEIIGRGTFGLVLLG